MTGGYIFTLCVSPHLDGGGAEGAGNPTHPGQLPPCPGQIPGQGGPGQGWGGYPHLGQIPGGGRGQGRGGVGTPPHPGQIPGQGVGQGGYPLSRSDPRMGGSPYWNGIACTCYAAGDMPLAFTQEDFLVTYLSGCQCVHLGDEMCAWCICCPRISVQKVFSPNLKTGATFSLLVQIPGDYSCYFVPVSEDQFHLTLFVALSPITKWSIQNSCHEFYILKEAHITTELKVHTL